MKFAPRIPPCHISLYVTKISIIDIIMYYNYHRYLIKAICLNPGSARLSIHLVGYGKSN